MKDADKAIILDIDGTLSDNRWRLKLLKSKKITQDEYIDLSVRDKKIRKSWDIIFSCMEELYDRDIRIIVLTERPYSDYYRSKAWLEFFDLYPTRIVMKPEGSKQCELSLKIEQLKLIEEEFDIVGVFEDNEEILEYCKDNGIATFPGE